MARAASRRATRQVKASNEQVSFKCACTFEVERQVQGSIALMQWVPYLLRFRQLLLPHAPAEGARFSRLSYLLRRQLKVV